MSDLFGTVEEWLHHREREVMAMIWRKVYSIVVWYIFI